MIREHIREEQEIKNKRVQQSPETTDERYKKFRDGKNENDKSDEMTIKRDSDRGIREFVKENSLRQFDEFVKRTDLYFEQSSNEEIFDTLYELIKEDIFKVDKENFLNLTIFSLGYAVKYLDEEEYQRLLEYTSDLIESRDVAERENIVDALIENKKFCLELDSVDDIERTFFGIIASSTNKKDDMSPSYSLFCETLIADDYKLTKGERNELGESNSKVDIILNEFEKFVSLYEKAFKETIANDLINSVTANEFDTESIGFLDKEYDIDYNPGFKTITEQTELQTKITDKEKEIKEAKLDIETREKTILVLGQEEIEGAKLEIETRKEAMLILEQELKQMTQELEQAKQKQQQNSKDTIYGLILDKKTFLKNLDKLPLDEKDKNKLNDLVTKINNIDMDFDYKLSKLENNHKDEMKFIKNTIDDEYNSFLKPSIVKKKKEDLGEQTTIIQLFNSTRRRIIDSTDDDEIANEIDSFIKKIHGTLTLAIDGDISKLKTITKNIYKELEHLDDLFDVNSLSLLRSIEYVESQLTQVLTDGKDISFNTYRKPIDIKFLSNSTQSTLNSTLKSLNSITKDTNEIDIDRMKNNISQLLRENNIKSSATILAKIYDTLNNNDNINKPLLDTILGAIHNTTSEYYAKEPELNSKLYLLTASFISAPAIDNKLPIPISNTDSLQLLCNKSIQDSLSSQISLKIVKDFYKKGLNENMSDFIKTIKDNKDLLSKMVVDISPVALTAFNNSLYINLHLLGETNIGKISIEIAKQTFPSDNFVSEFNNMTTVILEQINSNTLIANPDEKIKSIKRTSLSLYKSFVDERKSIEMRLKNANTYNNKVDTILPNLISSTLLQAKLSQVKDSDSLIVEIIEELKPQGKEITEIVEGIIQFSIPDENNIKKEDLSPIKLVLSSESVSPKLKEELKQSVFNKILNSQNSNCIEQLSELNFTGDIKKDILISSNQEQLTQLFLASKASQEFKKSLLDVLLKSVETSKNKEYLDKINKVLADIVPTFIHTMPRELLPLDKIFKLNPKLANNELVLESICNSDKRSFEDFKLINEKRTLNEKEILKFITETPLRSEQVEQQKDEVLKVFKLITQGKIKSSKTINKFKEEDMRELATFFSKNIDVYTTEIANIFKDNLETKLYKTFNEELAQKLINYVSSPQQQNDNQKQGPQPIVLTTQTKLEERREREKSNSNERENN
jgi:hypothetical protein